MIEVVEFFGMLGLLTAVGMWLISAEGNKKYFLPLILSGLTSGWFVGLIYNYTTGGVSLPLYAVTFPVVFSMFISTVILIYAPIPNLSQSVSNRDFKIALIILIISGLFVAYTAIPITGVSSMNTEKYNIQAENMIQTMKLDSRDVSIFSTNPTNQIPIQIKGLASSVQLFSTSDEPYVGSYLHFRIDFSISGYNWIKPYVKIAIFKDDDDNGQISTGDELLQSANYKVITNIGSWRANVRYINGQPTDEIFTMEKTYSQYVILPIFHASQISVWKDDSQYTFSNTPEGYKPPQDMISWDNTVKKEEVVSYETIPVDSTSSIEGKIYCSPNSQGKYLILVQAYDARFTNPYENNNPLSQKIIPFEIKEGKPSVTIDWTMAVVLTAITMPSVASILLYKRW